MTAPTVILPGGITANDVYGGTGRAHYVEDIDGWDGPDVRVVAEERTGQHGAVPLSLLYAPRALVVRGRSVPAAGESVATVLDVLTGAFNALDADEYLTVNETIPKGIGVRKTGRFRARLHPQHVEWELPLTAFDPRRYAVDDGVVNVTMADAAASVDWTMTNAGNAPSVWRLVVLVTPAVTDLARWWELRNVTTGQIVSTRTDVGGGTGGVRWDFEVGARRLLYGGALRNDMINLSATTWFALRPGANTLRLTRNGGATTGTVAVEARWRNAWW